MKTPPALPLSLLLLLAAAPLQETTVRYPDPDAGEDALAARRAEQLATADDLRVRHDFAFVDRLEESGITFRHRVVDDAARSYTAAHYDHGTGLAVADVDGDGALDLYFVNQLGGNELWRGLGDGGFENVTEDAGVALADRISVAASFADIDNDGDPDLFVTTVRMGNALFENDGAGVFRDISESAGVDYVGHSSGAVFFDYDRDGLLDLFVTNVGTYTNDETGEGGFYRALPDAFSGHLMPERFERSLLYHNLGGDRFEEVAEELGLMDEGFSGDATAVDFDEDGYPELYVLNMQGDDRYWVNEGGERFVDRTAEHFPRSPWGAMGIKAFDQDNDGDLDLLLTDMHSDMNEARAPDEETEKQRFQDKYFYQLSYAHILGNAFWRNDGDGAFTEVSDELGLENYWPWGVSVGDVNADGWQDVFIASSMNYPFRYGINALRLNDRGEGFVPAEFILGVEPRRDGRVRQEWFRLDCDGRDAGHDRCEGLSGQVTVLGTLGSRTAAIVDLEGDGDLDIVTGEFHSEPQVLVSNLNERQGVHWLAVELEGTTSNRDGIGARVAVVAGDRLLVQVKDGKSGYLSQSDVPLYFGLGEAGSVDSVMVRWPSGGVQTVEGPIEANRTIVIAER
jgi:hypothetical protein